MAGPPMRIHQEGAVPSAVHTPSSFLFAFQQQVKDELQSQGIIKPAGDKPSDWHHPLVMVPKVSVRLTINLTKLNRQVSCHTHPTPSPLDAVRSIGSSVRFCTTMDAFHGYWQLELAKENQHLTTFITP